MNENWRWPNWILMFLGLAVLIILSFSFPETNHATILYHRAQRLKARTGDGNLRSQGEKDQARLTLAEMTRTSLLRPILISLDPAPLFLGIYLGLVYAIFYLFFESFPLVFGDIYGFNLGEQGE
jgi:DHA1 family multidrug resistance protein-like MFS transporter